MLLAEDFGDKVEWELDGFFEQELSGDRGREWGFAQSIAVPILQDPEKLKLGLEMLYRNHTDHPTRSDPTQLFELGPSLAWKLTRSARVDFTPRLGTGRGVFGTRENGSRSAESGRDELLLIRIVAGRSPLAVADRTTNVRMSGSSSLPPFIRVNPCSFHPGDCSPESFRGSGPRLNCLS